MTLISRPLAFLTIIVPFLCNPSVSAARDGGAVKLRSVVIDAGHGGHDPGTVSADGKIKESAINLEVALALGRKIESEYPDMKVIYTRKKDVFIPLAERASIANRNHADLFISIHVNSARKGASASGTETFVMGTDKSDSNMEVCKRENSVILLEDDYSTTYQGFDPDNAESYIFFNLMQNAHFEQSIALASLVEQNLSKGPVTKSRGFKQAPLMVLWRTTMTSVLVEIGFLSNQGDRKILSQKQCRTQIADRIFDAFCGFKSSYETSSSEDAAWRVESPSEDAAPATPEAPATPVSMAAPAAPAAPASTAPAVPASTAASGPVYAVQIFAISKKLSDGDPEFKGLDGVERRYVNNIYKYSVGNYSSKKEASEKLKEIRKKFPDAFIVTK